MKKLLILIIKLTCIGCGDECLEADTVMGPDTGIPSGGPCDNPQSDCGWFKDWNSCTCNCEWIF